MVKWKKNNITQNIITLIKTWSNLMLNGILLWMVNSYLGQTSSYMLLLAAEELRKGQTVNTKHWSDSWPPHELGSLLWLHDTLVSVHLFTSCQQQEMDVAYSWSFHGIVSIVFLQSYIIIHHICMFLLLFLFCCFLLFPHFDTAIYLFIYFFIILSSLWHCNLFILPLLFYPLIL